jgi:hypothetical protein
MFTGIWLSSQRVAPLIVEPDSVWLGFEASPAVSHCDLQAAARTSSHIAVACICHGMFASLMLQPAVVALQVKHELQ